MFEDGSGNPPTSSRDLLEVKRLVAVIAVGMIAGAACGGDDASAPAATAGAAVDRLVRANGCASCHGADGSGGVGPSWIGLYGAEVELSDGSTVVADEEYLAESIRDPAAKRVAGYPVAMPSNDLTDEEISQIVEYITSLT